MPIKESNSDTKIRQTKTRPKETLKEHFTENNRRSCIRHTIRTRRGTTNDGLTNMQGYVIVFIIVERNNVLPTNTPGKWS